MSKTLLDEFADIPLGKVEDPIHKKHIEQVLINQWDNLNLINDFTSMKGNKLSGRMENIEWNPPLLTFIIERHGQTVMGSSRAGLFKWTIDTSNNTAEIKESGHRQLSPMSKRYNPTEDAEAIVSLIISGSQDSRLTWKEDGQKVIVNISQIVPSGGSQQTEISRRKRFRKECEERLSALGWQVLRYNTYQRPSDQ